MDLLIQKGKEDIYKQVELGRIAVGISSSRHDSMIEATRARLANLEVPIVHVIVRENGNYDTDIVFKIKWALRLETNYTVAEFFDRDPLVGSEVMKSIEHHRKKKMESVLVQQDEEERK
jgi:hypothetical protein